MFVDVFIDTIPPVQIATMILFNLFFMYYVCQIIEFESRYLTWTSRIKEVIILIGEILIMVLHRQETTKVFRDLIGWIIIVLLRR